MEYSYEELRKEKRKKIKKERLTVRKMSGECLD